MPGSRGPRPAARAVLVLAALAALGTPTGCGSTDPARGQPRPSVAAPAQPRGSSAAGSTAGAVTTGGAGTSATPTPTAAAASPPAIVGEWTRFQRCEQLVHVLRQAGLGSAVARNLVGDGWLPDVTDPADVDLHRPCRGAIDRHHTHFFTADGQFGSRDADGVQVDDGTYRLVGRDRLVIDGVTFRYTITDGVDLALVPMLPPCPPRCDDAQWSVSVAYPGYFWHRDT